MDKKLYKRRKYILDKSFQYGFIRKIMALTVFSIIGSLVFLVLVYYKYGDIRVVTNQPLPIALSGGTGATSEPQSHSLLELLWPVLAFCLLGTVIFTFCFGLILSHRMAGPVFRIQRILNEMSQGDLSKPSGSLRKRDELKSLFCEVNILKERWCKSIHELQHLSEKIDIESNGEQNQRLNRLREILSAFKTE